LLLFLQLGQTNHCFNTVRIRELKSLICTQIFFDTKRLSRYRRITHCWYKLCWVNLLIKCLWFSRQIICNWQRSVKWIKHATGSQTFGVPNKIRSGSQQNPGFSFPILEIKWKEKSFVFSGGGRFKELLRVYQSQFGKFAYR
jgi:hypothetical protein